MGGGSYGENFGPLKGLATADLMSAMANQSSDVMKPYR